MTDGLKGVNSRAWVHSASLRGLGYGQHCPIVPITRRLWCDDEGLVVQSDPATWGTHELPEDAVFDETPGFLVLYLAPLETDPTVESAALLVRDSLRSLLSTCGDEVPVEYEKIRTALEVRKYMDAYRFQFSHLVLIGHGSTEGITFLDEDAPRSGPDFAELLGCKDGCRQLEVISLCCHTGCSNMASSLSQDPSIAAVIAPDGPFDMRWASIFVQSLFLKLFDDGASIEEAVRLARFDQPICVWRDGTCDRCSDRGSTSRR